ncbi:hypothetical protein NKH99_30380 [Mesorhizobium sp. M0854]|uniref:hypothetical protein n=1 Tax=Mesorhizobium sp. M0854 TaxID=2957013 RepID=UPI003336FA1B
MTSIIEIPVLKVYSTDCLWGGSRPQSFHLRVLNSHMFSICCSAAVVGRPGIAETMWTDPPRWAELGDAQ